MCVSFDIVDGIRKNISSMKIGVFVLSITNIMVDFHAVRSQLLFISQFLVSFVLSFRVVVIIR